MTITKCIKAVGKELKGAMKYQFFYPEIRNVDHEGANMYGLRFRGVQIAMTGQTLIGFGIDTLVNGFENGGIAGFGIGALYAIGHSYFTEWNEERKMKKKHVNLDDLFKKFNAPRNQNSFIQSS